MTIVAHIVSLPPSPAVLGTGPDTGRSTPEVVCLDCHDALSREVRAAAVYVGDVHSWETNVRHCDRCDSQVNGPIHLDPGASSWGPEGSN